jgi:chlorophyll(ide) b reductase
VVITGSSRGLGLAMAKEFVKCGDSVVVHSRYAKSAEEARAALQPLCTVNGQNVLALTGDVGNAADMDAIARSAKASLGRIDLWVNNAGATQHPKASLATTDPDDIQRVVSTNLIGSLFGCRAALGVMLEQRSGTIFNVDGSGSRGNATPKSAAYGASKAAVPQLGETLAREVRGSGISVHTVSPGMVMTDLLLTGTSPGALKIFNILAEHPETTAGWLVPRMRAATSATSGVYIKYLTPASVAWRFATSPWRHDRLVKVPAS